MGRGSGFRMRGARARYDSQGPCWTDVLYFGRVGSTGIRWRNRVNLGRTDDVTRTTFRLRMDADRAAPFSRLAIFQAGADTYATTVDRKFAVGNVGGLVEEWAATPGGDAVVKGPVKVEGAFAWASLYETVGNPGEPVAEDAAWANRGVVLRKWDARLGGKPAQPWFQERSVTQGAKVRSIMELVPPPGVTALAKGDYVEAELVFVALPQKASDYYGPNAALRVALAGDGDTWKMVHREAVWNYWAVKVLRGRLVASSPAIEVAVDGEGKAAFSMARGLGFVPVRIHGLKSPKDGELRIDGKVFSQAVHGKDFWQCDFNAGNGTWTRTYNIPGDDGGERVVAFRRSEWDVWGGSGNQGIHRRHGIFPVGLLVTVRGNRK